MYRSGSLFLVLTLAGCPDAVRGEAASDAGTTSPETSVPIGDASPEGAVGVRQRLGAPSGNLALGPSEVFVQTATGIVSVPRNGGDASAVATGNDLTLGGADAASVYYAKGSGTGELFQVSARGNNPKSLGQGIAPAAGLGMIEDRIFWVNFVDVVSQSKADATKTVIRKAGGSDSIVLVAVTDPYVVVLVYSGGTKRLVRRRKTDDDLTADKVLTTAAPATRSLVAVDGKVAYWFEEHAGIRAASLDGISDPRSVTGDPSLFDFGAMAVDATHVYWAQRNGRIARASRATGTAEPFADGFEFPEKVATPYPDNPEPEARRLAVDDTYLYVSDKTGLYRVQK